MSDVSTTLDERGARYGLFHDNAMVAQQVKITMRATPQWDNLTPDMREALDQIACKISRLLSGDPFYADNWRDMAGYATLVLQSLAGDKQ